MLNQICLFLFDGASWLDSWRESYDHMFSLKEPGDINWPEKFLRPIVIYFALIILLRIFGKRELAQLNPFDLVLILILSNTVQNGIIGNDTSVSGAVVGAIALLAVNWTMAQLKYRIPILERAVEGLPVPIIKKGKVDEKARRQELLTDRDFEIIAHKNGLDDACDIEKLVIDPNGGILVDGKEELRDAQFKRTILKKIDALSKQIDALGKAQEK